MAEFGLLQAASIVATLVLLEAVLSFDNAAILAVLSRRLPLGAGRRRALNYGLAIAYVLRIVAILAAVILVQYTWFLTIGGAYLVFLFLKHFFGLARGKAHAEATLQQDRPAKGFLGLNPFQSIILQIGLVDLAFALDQVVAAVAFTKDVPEGTLFFLTYQQALIIAAATAGLVSLRVLAPFISRLMDWLPLLEHVAFVAIGFVGALLLLEHPQLVASPQGLVHAVEPYKVPITLGLFAVPVAIKLLFKWPRSNKAHAQIRADMKGAEAAETGQPPAGGKRP